MTCKVTADWYVKDGKREELIEIMRGALPQTRKWDGCIQLDLSINQDNPPHLVMTEEWGISQHHKDYFQARVDEGMAAALMVFLEQPPKFTYCDLTDV